MMGMHRVAWPSPQSRGATNIRGLAEGPFVFMLILHLLGEWHMKCQGKSVNLETRNENQKSLRGFAPDVCCN